MNRQRRLSPEEARYEKAKAERAQLIVSMAIGDRKLMQEALGAYQESEAGAGMSWDEFLRWEKERREKENLTDDV